MALKNNDWVLVSFRGLCFNQQIILTQWYLVAGDFPAVNTITQDLTLIVNGVAPAGAGDIATAYLACLPVQYQMQTIRAQRIKASRSSYFSQVNLLAGSNVNPCTVASDAAAITMKGDNAGRNNLSTKKIGPVPDAASAAGLLTVAYTALLNTLGSRLALAWTPPTSGSTLVPIVPHKDGITNEIINNWSVGPESRVHRRRTVGLGK